MKAENTIQWMLDFYSDIFPTRKHCLDHLFCSIGNGYHWENGELVDSDPLHDTYQMVGEIKRAKGRTEDLWYTGHEKQIMWAKEFKDFKPDSKYIFNWYPLSKGFSKLYNYPADIKPDWLAVLNECKLLLIADGYINENGDFLISKEEMITRKLNKPIKEN